ncbi:hypothetical protein D9M71_682010 [compost metagenome]
MGRNAPVPRSVFCLWRSQPAGSAPSLHVFWTGILHAFVQYSGSWLPGPDLGHCPGRKCLRPLPGARAGHRAGRRSPCRGDRQGPRHAGIAPDRRPQGGAKPGIGRVAQGSAANHQPGGQRSRPARVGAGRIRPRQYRAGPAQGRPGPMGQQPALGTWLVAERQCRGQQPGR